MSVFSDILNLLIRLFIPAIIIYLLWTIVNIVKDYKMYGNKIFSAFKKYNGTGNLKDIIINVLEQECIEKPIIISNNKTSFFALTDKEIYGVVIVEFDGKLSGKVMDKYLVVNGKEQTYLNPLGKFTEYLKSLKKQGINIHPIVIKSGQNIDLQIENLASSHIMSIKDFSYYIYKNQRENKKYNHDTLKKYSKVVEKTINGHN